MLYSIIPPVLVIVSLAGIIIFLMKKAPAMARLEDSARVLSEEEKNEQELSARYAALRKENRKTLKDKMIGTSKGAISSVGGLFTSGKATFRKINDNAKAKMEATGKSRDRERRGDFFQNNLDNRIRITDNETYPQAAALEEAPEEELVAKKDNNQDRPEKKDLFEKILIDRIASNPKDIEAYERLGEYYLEIENWEYAKECFKQVLKLNPRNIGIRSKMRKLERILSK